MWLCCFPPNNEYTRKPKAYRQGHWKVGFFFSLSLFIASFSPRAGLRSKSPQPCTYWSVWLLAAGSQTNNQWLLSTTVHFPSQIHLFYLFVCLVLHGLQVQIDYHQFVKPKTQSAPPRVVVLMPGVLVGGGESELQPERTNKLYGFKKRLIQAAAFYVTGSI